MNTPQTRLRSPRGVGSVLGCNGAGLGVVVVVQVFPTCTLARGWEVETRHLASNPNSLLWTAGFSITWPLFTALPSSLPPSLSQ